MGTGRCLSTHHFRFCFLVRFVKAREKLTPSKNKKFERVFNHLEEPARHYEKFSSYSVALLFMRTHF